MLGDLLQHDLKTLHLLLERRGSTIFLLGFEVLGGKIRRHGNYGRQGDR
jgi:hypothetical protein